MFFDFLNPGMIARQFASRGLEQSAADPESMFGPVFSDLDMSRELTLSADVDGTEREISYRFVPSGTIKSPLPSAKEGVVVQLVKGKPPETTGGIEISYRLTRAEVYKYLLTFEGGALTLKNVPKQVVDRRQDVRGVIINAFSRVDAAEDARRFGRLDEQGKAGKVFEVLRLIEPDLKALSVIPVGPSPVIFGDIGLKRKIPVSLMGEGMTRLLSMVLAIADAANGVALLDEIDNGLYWKVMPKIWEALAAAAVENNVQVFATTHSKEMILSAVDGIPEKNLKDFRYIRLDRSADKITPRVYDHSTLRAAFETDIEIR